MIQTLNERILHEQYSSRLYYAMYLWLESRGYKSAKLWKKYSEEELVHAKWAEDYLDSLNIKPEIRAIPEPPCEYAGLPDIIYKTLEHEQLVTEECQTLAKVALSELDMLTFGLAMKYVNEQAEELDKSYTLVNKLETFGTDIIAIKLLDNELGE